MRFLRFVVVALVLIVAGPIGPSDFRVLAQEKRVDPATITVYVTRQGRSITRTDVATSARAVSRCR